jgi:hypothetical protein
VNNLLLGKLRSLDEFSLIPQKHLHKFRFNLLFLHIYPLPANTQNDRVAGLVVSPFRFPKIVPICLTSNPLSQIVTSNLRLQPDIHFAVDKFQYKKTEFFQKSGFKSKPPKKPGNMPFSGT